MRAAFVKKTARKPRKMNAMVSWRRSVIVEPFTFSQRLLGKDQTKAKWIIEILTPEKDSEVRFPIS